MKVVIFCHSIVSCWNHGNAHFLRGIARELIRAGHHVCVYEPEDGWSRRNALADGGGAVLAEAALLVPGMKVHLYPPRGPELDSALDGAGLVLVHEWTAPALVSAIGRARRRGGRFTLLFHDTHHRAVTAPEALSMDGLEDYDGVLAFGEALREIHARRGWGARAFTWHEAADTALFRPRSESGREADITWIGNWGDGERTRELRRYLFAPIARLGLAAVVHGVRYPAEAPARLARWGIAFRGWLPNHRVPDAFAKARATVHVPRRPYADALPGIPTIRMFEALACGIPLICAPWRDTEDLFGTGCYLAVRNGREAAAALRAVLNDAALAEDLRRTGLAAIRTRHNCARRMSELLAIVDSIRMPPRRSAAAIRSPMQGGAA